MPAIITNLSIDQKESLVSGWPSDYFFKLVDTTAGREKWVLEYPGMNERTPRLVALSERFWDDPGSLRVYLALRYDPRRPIPVNLFENRVFERVQDRLLREAQKIVFALKHSKTPRVGKKHSRTSRVPRKTP